MFLMLGPLAVALRAGQPFSFVTGAPACITLFVFGNAAMLNTLPSRIFPLITGLQLSAIPPFIFMAWVLERAGVIADPAWLFLKLETDAAAARQRVRSTRSRPWS